MPPKYSLRSSAIPLTPPLTTKRTPRRTPRKKQKGQVGHEKTESFEYSDLHWSQEHEFSPERNHMSLFESDDFVSETMNDDENEVLLLPRRQQMQWIRGIKWLCRSVFNGVVSLPRKIRQLLASLMSFFRFFQNMWFITPLVVVLITAILPERLLYSVLITPLQLNNTPNHNNHTINNIGHINIPFQLETNLHLQIQILNETIGALRSEIIDLKMVKKEEPKVNQKAIDQSDVINSMKTKIRHLDEKLLVLSKAIETLDSKVIKLQNQTLPFTSFDFNETRIRDILIDDSQMIRELVYDAINRDKDKIRSVVAEEVKYEVSNQMKECSKKNRNETQSLNAHFKEYLSNALEIYDADKLGKVDFACLTSGARIIRFESDILDADLVSYIASRKRLTSLTYSRHLTWRSKLHSILMYPFTSGNHPEKAIKTESNLGDCWSFPGHSGQITIQLSSRIIPSSISLEHISRRVTPDISSSPKTFEVFGVETKTYRGAKSLKYTSLGVFTYETTKSSTQTFSTTSETISTKGFEYVNVKFRSNYGNPNYTCIYRIRVHGSPVDN